MDAITIEKTLHKFLSTSEDEGVAQKVTRLSSAKKITKAAFIERIGTEEFQKIENKGWGADLQCFESMRFVYASFKGIDYIFEEDNKEHFLATLEVFGFSASDLDNAVHEVVSRLGSDINNKGVDEQKKFLNEQGYDVYDIAAMLKSI